MPAHKIRCGQQISNLTSPGSLEFDARAQLDRARIEHAGGAAKVHIRHIGYDSARIQIDTIEQIVELGAELEPGALITIKPRYAEASPEAEVYQSQSGPAEGVAPEIATASPTLASSRYVAPRAIRYRKVRRRHESVDKI
jgi:hypothetical protein